MKKILFVISMCLCFASQGKAQNVSKTYQPLNDSTASVKDSLTFEQRMEQIERMKRKIDDKLLRYEAGITGGLRSDNEDYYMVEISAAYYPLKYAGVALGLEWDDNRGGKPLMQSLKDANGYEEYDPDRVIAINVNPGLAFRTLGWIASNYNIEYCRNNIYYTNDKRYNGIDKYKHSGTLFASITGQF